VKFVCDRCKTRYSIGEDRVRGKILKIRCKNCANVITVREGMEPGAASEASAAPAPSPAPARGGAPPPSALEDEWYVSIDGQQSGPLSLEAARRWITQKPAGADLHCWKEGFDDWLPVDKVSHFRNLRQRTPPRPSAPPPIPRREDEPKPLFAATMAAISAPSARTEAPQTTGKEAPTPSPATAKANGSGATPALPTSTRGSGPTASVGGPRARSASGRMPAITAAAAKSAGAAALVEAFEPDADDAGDSRTAVQPPPALGAFDVGGRDDAATPAMAPAAATPTVQQALESDDDDLAIGEVSRVVKLADLVPKPKPQPAAAARATQSTPALARISSPALTGAQPKISPTELGMNVDPALLAATAHGAPGPDESMVARSFAQRHRRSLIALISVSAVLVLGAIGAIAYVTSQTNDELGGRLGGSKQIDTSRPEDLVRRQLHPETPGAGSATTTTPTTVKRPQVTRPQTPIQAPEETDPTKRALSASEVEDMAARQNEGTKRCYMRAQKGALGFDIAGLKKITVTLQVARNGTVTDVQLSSNSKDEFGQCLIARIKAWKFRESSAGGTFRISLAFSSS
jgi:predicted Zn finger-like uncharacterized protein